MLGSGDLGQMVASDRMNSMIGLNGVRNINGGRVSPWMIPTFLGKH